MKTYTVLTYDNEILDVTIGNEYTAEGYCGMTDGLEVTGKLIDVDIMHSSAIIWCNKRKQPCAVNLSTIKLKS